MKPHIALMLIALSVCSCGDKSRDYSASNPPNAIDLKVAANTGCGNWNDDLWACGQLAFNSSPEIGAYLVYLKDTYGLETAVETGTFNGNTTVFLSYLFDDVRTVEFNETTYTQSSKKLESRKNVTAYLGSSEQVLEKILPSLKGEPILFYLDAHWNEFWSLLDELSVIGKTHRDNCVIVIDDFKVPGRPDIGYDKYEEKECSYEYIRARLNEVFSDYSHTYLIPHSKHGHAKLVVVPKHLATKQPG